MNLRIVVGLLSVCAFLCGCRSPETTETGEMRQELRQQMAAQRQQLKAAGATAAQLAEFDRAMAQMGRAMRQMEKQMRTLERQADQ